MSACTHDLTERETACADGYCPMCLVADLDAARADRDAARNSIDLWKERAQDADHASNALAAKLALVEAELDRVMLEKQKC